MISLFRKIRQKLLQQHRITQYLAYAVGEIFLVVIGILIALQINTWNEERKNRDYELKMLRELKSTLEKDSRYFRSQIRILGIKELSANRLLQEIQLPDPSMDSINFHLERLEIEALFQYNSGAYGSIKSGGIDKISNDSLRSKIADLYEFLIPRTEKILENLKETESIEEQLIEDFTERVITKAPDGDQIINRKILNRDEILKDEFLHFIQINKSITYYTLNRLQILLPQIEDLVFEIEKELPSD
ncbi:MAG TPA: DUF6090 family protein [Algoriphagus sp.]|nr:DUF6090 family protein [Algoriphagus sp.]